MRTLTDKVKAGSPITGDDLIGALKWTLGRQTFKDYISGVPDTDLGKQELIEKVNSELEHLFSPLFTLLPRVNKKPDDTAGFIIKHFNHKGFKINDHLGANRIDILCDECKVFCPVKSSPK
jgi:hypothetical protein